MKTLLNLISRNCKLFFKDKSVSLSALIAPLVLLFLFIVFLGDVYRDSLLGIIPEGVDVPQKGVEGFAAGWLMSSLLSVSAVSISFTSNLIMVQDRVMGRENDFAVSPVPKSMLALGYYISTALVTLAVCYAALFVGFVYISIAGWFLSVSDVFFAMLDVLLLVLFGTALSSVVCSFLRSQGGITVVEVVVSAAYGFLCGAYMPISQLAAGLQNLLMFLPGTYGTALLHEHFMGGAIDSFEIPAEFLSEIRSGFDCTLSFFGNEVPVWAEYLVLAVAVAVLVGAYVLRCSLSFRKKGGKK